jgi:hypothetical protein
MLSDVGCQFGVPEFEVSHVRGEAWPLLGWRDFGLRRIDVGGILAMPVESDQR